MFETFVTGPLGTLGFGLARRCEGCARSGAAAGCTGFGAGCLVRASDARPVSRTFGAAGSRSWGAGEDRE